jgi:hypothetical protein
MSLFWSVAAPVYGCVKGRSVERDNIQCISSALRTTAYLRSTTPYHPHGVPIFPYRQKQKIAVLQIITQNTSEQPVQESRKRRRNPLLHPSPYRSGVIVISFSNLEGSEIRFG